MIIEVVLLRGRVIRKLWIDGSQGVWTVDIHSPVHLVHAEVKESCRVEKHISARGEGAPICALRIMDILPLVISRILAFTYHRMST